MSQGNRMLLGSLVMHGSVIYIYFQQNYCKTGNFYDRQIFANVRVRQIRDRKFLQRAIINLQQENFVVLLTYNDTVLPHDQLIIYNVQPICKWIEVCYKVYFPSQVGAVRADPNDGTSTWVWAKDRSPIDVGGNPPSNPSRFCAFFYIKPNRFYALHCTSQPKNTFWCELPRDVAPFPISHVIG